MSGLDGIEQKIEQLYQLISVRFPKYKGQVIAQILGPVYSQEIREVVAEANHKIDELTSIAIQTAVAIGGLVGVMLTSNSGNSKTDFILTKVGLLFVLLSIGFGILQKYLDYKFYERLSKSTRKIYTNFFLINMDLGSLDQLNHDFDEIKNSLLEIEKIGLSSSLMSLYFQITFLLIGIVFVVVDVIYF